jgi:hypothetical protein
MCYERCSRKLALLRMPKRLTLIFLEWYKPKAMAEKQGFEPWEGINPQRFSRPPLSTAQPPLRKPHIITY